MPHFGAHMSISGGLDKAIERIRRVDGEALQVFTRNQRMWRTKALTDEAVAAFLEAKAEWGFPHVAAHVSYLVNLASPKEDIRAKSIDALADELGRAQRLDIPYVVLHPGSHGGDGLDVGVERIVAGLDAALERSQTDAPMLLLENTAGQGTGVGSAFEDLARVIDGVALPERIGICFDTCHAFAAGYDMRSPEAFQATMDALDASVGLARLKFFHLNDAKKGLGSHLDRHEHIGQGAIGRDGFRNLVRDPRFAGHPMVLETPKDDADPDLNWDQENLAILRELAA
jgi:deoxyribonuclease-4